MVVVFVTCFHTRGRVLQKGGYSAAATRMWLLWEAPFPIASNVWDDVPTRMEKRFANHTSCAYPE